MANLSKEQLWKALQQPADKSCYNCIRDENNEPICLRCHENDSVFINDIVDGIPQYPDWNWKWNGKSK